MCAGFVFVLFPWWVPPCLYLISLYSEPLKGIRSYILSVRGQAAWWFPFKSDVPQQMDPKK